MYHLTNLLVLLVKDQLSPTCTLLASASNLYKLSLTLIDTEEGHLLIENVVNIFFCNTFIGIVAQSSRLA
jgi:hypothetical protein